VTLVLFALPLRPQWPRPRDLAATMLATATMAVTLAPLRDWQTGLVGLCVLCPLGVAIYGASAAALDVAGLRTRLVPALRARGARRVSVVGEGGE
jgi:hypothetical protein